MHQVIWRRTFMIWPFSIMTNHFSTEPGAASRLLHFFVLASFCWWEHEVMDRVASCPLSVKTANFWVFILGYQLKQCLYRVGVPCFYLPIPYLTWFEGMYNIFLNKTVLKDIRTLLLQKLVAAIISESAEYLFANMACSLKYSWQLSTYWLIQILTTFLCLIFTSVVPVSLWQRIMSFISRNSQQLARNLDCSACYKYGSFSPPQVYVVCSVHVAATLQTALLADTFLLCLGAYKHALPSIIYILFSLHIFRFGSLPSWALNDCRVYAHHQWFGADYDSLENQCLQLKRHSINSWGDSLIFLSVKMMLRISYHKICATLRMKRVRSSVICKFHIDCRFINIRRLYKTDFTIERKTAVLRGAKYDW